MTCSAEMNVLAGSLRSRILQTDIATAGLHKVITFDEFNPPIENHESQIRDSWLSVMIAYNEPLPCLSITWISVDFGFKSR